MMRRHSGADHGFRARPFRADPGQDQEDIAVIYKRATYADVKIFTLSEGELSRRHAGLKGTMNARFLKDPADKTRSGQRGRVEAGKSGGGNSYGHDVAKSLMATASRSAAISLAF